MKPCLRVKKAFFRVKTNGFRRYYAGAEDRASLRATD
jgi:hypothetical protein